MLLAPVLAHVLACVLACASTTPAPPQPPPPPSLVERYGSQPDAVVAEVLALAPFDRELAVVELGAAWPDQLSALCEALDPGRLRSRCERLDATRPARLTPASAWLEPPPVLVGRWQDLEGAAPTCEPERQVPCLADAARAAAMRGELIDAALACQALPDGRVEQDCFASSATQLPQGERRFADGLALCGGAGEFAVACHEDLLLELVPGDPATVKAAQLEAGAQQVRAAWAELSPAHAVKARDLYWAVVAGRLLATLDPLPELLKAELPRAAQPHLRSARALRALSTPDPLLSARAGKALPPAPALPTAARWTRSPPGSPTLRRIPFRDLRGGLRPTAPDPDVDLGLAVLTAAALAEPPQLELLATVATTSDEPPLLRWGAANLLAELAPSHPALETVRQDPEAMVRMAVD